MKAERKNAILKLIKEQNIYTQDELTAALQKTGYSVAQATVSRDIRELGLVKDPSSQKYILPQGGKNPLERVFRDALVSVDSAGNMLVIRTLSGMAMAVAAALDEMNFPEILVSVAGDDCVMCVVKSKQQAASLTEKLR
jgi:transcriptional regulator of arginine metabolism